MAWPVTPVLAGLAESGVPRQVRCGMEIGVVGMGVRLGGCDWLNRQIPLPLERYISGKRWGEIPHVDLWTTHMNTHAHTCTPHT